MSTDTPAQAKKRCQYCDDTGDVHTPTGEWRGDCICEAGKALFMDRPPVAASPQPAAAQPLTDEDWRTRDSSDTDEGCAALHRAHGIGATTGEQR